MSSNYEWQKFQAGERVQARLREAQAHRQARRGNPHPARALPFSIAFSFGLALVVWLLAGCTSAAPVTAAPANVISRAEIVGPAGQLPGPDPGADHRLRVTIARERIESGEVPASEGDVDRGFEGPLRLRPP